MGSSLQYGPDAAHMTKHKWKESCAGVVKDADGKRIGKCPEAINLETAQALLSDGIWYWGRRKNLGKHPKPERVCNVFEGVPYRAHIMGSTYHGFPEVPRNLPPAIREQLREKAEKEGYGERFAQWLTKHKDA